MDTQFTEMLSFIFGICIHWCYSSDNCSRHFKVESEMIESLKSYCFYSIRFMLYASFFFGFLVISRQIIDVFYDTFSINRGLILGSVVGAVLFNHDNLKEFMFENEIFNNTLL
jgi:hypothetical protein